MGECKGGCDCCFLENIVVKTVTILKNTYFQRKKHSCCENKMGRENIPFALSGCFSQRTSLYKDESLKKSDFLSG